MISILRLDFDHDISDKADRFLRFSKAVTEAGCFDGKPLIVDTPLFSYRRAGSSHLDGLLDQIGTQDAVVFLSEICCYSFALVQTNRSAARFIDFDRIAEYPTLQSFLETPQIVGHSVSVGGFSLLDPNCHVLGMMPSPYSSEMVDEETWAPKPEFLDVQGAFEKEDGAVYVYRILDQAKNFPDVLACDWPVYVFTQGAVDLTLALELYHDESLTEYLLSLSIPFGTLNDNHQDDYFVVSYHKPFWRVDDQSLAFVA